MFFCYTTVFHAIELFSLAVTERERSEVRKAMSAMKILGLNPKNSSMYGNLVRRNARLSTMNLLIAGVCCESHLPLVTGRLRDFRGLRELNLIRAADLEKLDDNALKVFAASLKAGNSGRRRT